jgi:hypothetical protein
MKLSALAVATALFSGAVFAAPLTLQTYNPQEKGFLPSTHPRFRPA